MCRPLALVLLRPEKRMRGSKREQPLEVGIGYDVVGGANRQGRMSFERERRRQAAGARVRSGQVRFSDLAFSITLSMGRGLMLWRGGWIGR